MWTDMWGFVVDIYVSYQTTKQSGVSTDYAQE